MNNTKINIKLSLSHPAAASVTLRSHNNPSGQGLALRSKGRGLEENVSGQLSPISSYFGTVRCGFSTKDDSVKMCHHLGGSVWSRTGHWHDSKKDLASMVGL